MDFKNTSNELFALKILIHNLQLEIHNTIYVIRCT